MQELTTFDAKNNNMDTTQNWERYYKMAEMLSTSDIVPACYRNKPANVFIAIQTAQTLKIDAMSIMQNTYIVNGKIGITSAFAISLANKSNYLKESIQYKVVGLNDDMEVTAYSTLKNDNHIEFTVTMKQAIAEGWATKRESKYKTLPQLMLMYRAAMFLIRTYLPQVLFCQSSSEELQDIETNQLKSVSENNLKSDKIANLKDKVKELANNTDEEKNEDITQEPLDVLKEMIVFHKIESAEIEKWLAVAKVETLLELNEEQIVKIIDYIKRKMV